MQNYKGLLSDTNNIDHNSCTVIASTLAFDQDYSEILKFYDKHGRKRGRGVQPVDTKYINLHLAKKFNYKAKYLEREEVLELSKGRTMTVGNCHNYLDSTKNYIIGVRGHSLAMVQGDIQDHTAGKKNRIKSIMELTLPPELLQPVKVESLDDTLSELTNLMSKF